MDVNWFWLAGLGELYRDDEGGQNTFNEAVRISAHHQAGLNATLLTKLPEELAIGKQWVRLFVL